jgi:hypothetical protein
MGFRSRRDDRAFDTANQFLPDIAAPDQLSLGGSQIAGVGQSGQYFGGPGATFQPGQAPGFTPMGTQMQDTQQLYGFLDPGGLNNAQRQATMGQLNNSALQAAVQRQAAGQAAGYGGTTSGTQLALQSQAGTNLAGQKAGAEAELWNQAIQRQLAMRSQAAQMGQGRALAGAQHGLGAYQAQGQLGLGGAQLGAQRESQMANFDLSRAGQLSDDMYRRQMSEYEANTLLPYQTDVAMQLARAEMAAGTRAGQRQRSGAIVGSSIGALGQLGGAAIGAM